eukprot:GCRY01004410.1.p1 GENE.GCRY01004410.1~~GCRY01004410.1.p1  ORF type:complete len:454 (+),score=88.64 GCRY01004410.1:203-1564(+)
MEEEPVLNEVVIKQLEDMNFDLRSTTPPRLRSNSTVLAESPVRSSSFGGRARSGSGRSASGGRSRRNSFASNSGELNPFETDAATDLIDEIDLHLPDEVRRKILIIYTGGTLGMKKQADGSYAPYKGFLNQQLLALDKTAEDQLPSWDLIEFDPLLDSSDIDPNDWQILASMIQSNYAAYDGFVILHGTDTMSYTASALSFMLENLAKPVILSGSMVPLGMAYNDARRNLIVSMMAAAQCQLPEVCIFFNEELYRGNRSTKADAWGLDAFRSYSFPPLGHLGGELIIRQDLCLPTPALSFQTHLDFCTNIVLLRIVPGLSGTLFQQIANMNELRGMIVLAYGTGNASLKHTAFLKTIKGAVDKGVVVVCLTQCPKGSVDFAQYATGRALESLGVVNGHDMTPEACYAKLGYLLSKKDLSPDVIKELMATSLRGELSSDDHLSRLRMSMSTMTR